MYLFPATEVEARNKIRYSAPYLKRTPLKSESFFFLFLFFACFCPPKFIGIKTQKETA